MEKRFIRIGTRYLNPEHIIEIETNYRKYYRSEKTHKQTVHIMLNELELEDVGESAAASASVALDFVHGTPEAQAMIGWLETQSEVVL